MSLIVFAGPTLAAETIRAAGDFRVLPPVAQGDLHRAALEKPRAIGIIDGYFSGAPSVWHKEILFALSEGVAVYGAASMGALRAAELRAFGMQGVGRIYEAYRDGILEDDDEVAVVHGPAELGFLALSEAMVNIRATLALAEAEGVLTAPAHEALLAFAKAQFYPHRTWDAALDFAAERLGEPTRAGLAAFLAARRVDQKRLDALELLAAMRKAAPAPTPAFKFERTLFYAQFVAEAEAREGAGDGALEELRLEGPETYARVEAAALLRLAADRGAAARPRPSGAEIAAALQALRARLHLFNRAQFEAWIADNGLDAASLQRLVEGEAQLAALRAGAAGALAPYLIDVLRREGAYARLAARARAKAQRPAPAPAPPAAALALRLWYFQSRLGVEAPDDVEAYAKSLGFARLCDFDAALQREKTYLECETVRRPALT